MKRITLVLLLSLLFFGRQNIYPNPIIVHHLNELKFTANEWQLELYELDFIAENLDGYYLTTLNDTASFKNGINLNGSEYLVVTNDNLTEPLFINPEGDVLTLYSPDDYVADELRFGNVDYPRVSAPKEGQSMSLNKDYQQDYDDYHYLDNSPTLGLVNDFTDAEGTIEGYVTDVLSNPLGEVKVTYDYYSDGTGMTWPVYVFTNSAGYFKLDDAARIEDLEFSREDYITQNTSQQIWPDSTVTLYIIMEEDPNVIDDAGNSLPGKYLLHANFPNPFNSSTKITYDLPIGDYVEISIFDMSGKFIQKLYSGFQTAGKYSIVWDARFLSSGVYVYQMTTSLVSMSKKCLLIK